MQTQTRRVRLQKFLRGIQICHMKADVLEIPKMWWFFILEFFKSELLLPKVDLKDPTTRQNFDDTLEQKRVIDLRACLMYNYTAGCIPVS